MNFRIARQFIGWALTLSLTLFCLSCGGDQGTDYTWFIDGSVSVAPGHQAKQQPQRDLMVEQQIAGLACGDTITLFAINAQTMNAAPLYFAEIPRGDTYDGGRACQQKLKQVRAELQQHFQAAFAPSQPALESDYLSALDRLRPQTGRRQQVFFGGDLVQSNAELDLEKVRLSPNNLAELLNPIVAKHGWRAKSLNGVEVYCILNSLDTSHRQPLNNRRLLRGFWAMLFEYLGADLRHFDASVISTGNDKEAL